MPDVDGGILQRLPSRDVGHLAVHVDDLSVGRRVKGDGGAVVPVRRVVSPEGAEDCRCREAVGAVDGGGVGDVVDEAGVRLTVSMDGIDQLIREMKDVRFHADDVAEQLSLVAPVVAHAPCLVDQLDAGHPLVGGELHLARKVVDVRDQGTHNLPQPGARLGPHGVNDILCEFSAQDGAVLLVGRHGCGAWYGVSDITAWSPWCNRNLGSRSDVGQCSAREL